MEKNTWTDRVRNEDRVKKERNILHKTKRRKCNWIGHKLHRDCLLKYFTEGMIEATGRRGRRLKQLPDDLKEMRRYWKLKEDALDRTVEN